ncbi:hypothetical protein D3C73_806300 [compost metagenome]
MSQVHVLEAIIEDVRPQLRHTSDPLPEAAFLANWTGPKMNEFDSIPIDLLP